jgi:four helix bundle protein
VGDFRSLRVWREAHGLVLRVYRETQAFPGAEQYGLTSQMRRSAASIPTNLAEGLGRDSQAELARFARIAQGSAFELQYQLLLARDLGYLPEETHAVMAEQCDHVRRMLAKFIRTL